ncbi:MAG: hypothetical protein GY820_14300 [Gammaproteobacteria bacterium]|nr:hypothetical protein [Gammaproteobacteria bacterium]
MTKFSNFGQNIGKNGQNLRKFWTFFVKKYFLVRKIFILFEKFMELLSGRGGGLAKILGVGKFFGKNSW